MLLSRTSCAFPADEDEYHISSRDNDYEEVCDRRIKFHDITLIVILLFQVNKHFHPSGNLSTVIIFKHSTFQSDRGMVVMI